MHTNTLLDLRTSKRAASYRFELLDRDENTIGEVHPSRDQTPTITLDTTRAIQRDMASFNLIPSEANDVNPVTDRIRPIMLLEDGTEHALGIFLFAEASNAITSYGRALASTLIDKGFIIDQPIDRTISLPSHAIIGTEIARLLRNLNLPAVVNVTGMMTGQPIAWPAGTVMSQVITDLGVLAGATSAWFDHRGVCHVEPVPDPEMTDPVVTYEAGRNIYAASSTASDDLLTAPNRFIVIGNDANQNPIIGRFDVPAGAPHSFYRRGFRVVEVIDVQGLSDSVVADGTAAAYARNHPVFEHLTFEGPPDPRHDSYAVIECFGERWLEMSWSLVLAPEGPMTHTLRKVYS